MLLRFEVGNHRSICEPVELSMVAMDKDRPAARQLEELDEKVLAVAAIYGANGSGKTNLIDALAWLSSCGRACRCAPGRTRSLVTRSASRPGHRSRRASG